MNCDQVRETASDALDAALPEERAARFRAHLEACPPCRAFFAELREALGLLSELPEIEVGEEFDAAVWARIRSERPARLPALPGLGRLVGWLDPARGGGSLGRWVPLGAAAAVLALFALSSGPAFEEGERPGALGRAGEEGISGEEIAAAAENEEISAGMPAAIEAYLRRSARDLRLGAEGDRFLQSRYSYPLRRVLDPGLLPVGTGGAVPPTAAGRRTSSDGGVTVISF